MQTDPHRTRFHPYLLALVAALLTLAAAWGASVNDLSPLVRALLAAVQVAPFVVLLWVFWQSLRRWDELQRRVHLEAVALAFAGTGLLTASYGFLQQDAGAPSANWGFLWPIMTGLWLVAFGLTSRRYR